MHGAVQGIKHAASASAARLRTAGARRRRKQDLKKVWPRPMTCRKTLLAPTYGGPVTSMFVLPNKREGVNGKYEIVDSDYVVYGTANKVVGLIKLPLDGNPNKTMAMIAHPGAVSGVVCTYDGRYLLTAGGDDRSINLWTVSTAALDASIELGGQGITPYLSLLEGGVDGEFYQEMLDYFIYAQLRSQGINTTMSRQITGQVPVVEVINLMRALNFYPPEQQIRNIMTEVIFSDYSAGELPRLVALSAKQEKWNAVKRSRSKKKKNYLADAFRFKTAVTLPEFIRLFVNNRPVFGLDNSQFEDAFASLGVGPDLNYTMARGVLVHKLQSLGEKFSDAELDLCLQTLLGRAAPNATDAKTALSNKKRNANPFLSKAFASMGGGSGGAGGTAGDETPIQRVEDVPHLKTAALLQPSLSPLDFAQNVLGFEDYNAPDANQ
jgi:Ca2+-binding EF-hand superfamily protein